MGRAAAATPLRARSRRKGTKKGIAKTSPARIPRPLSRKRAAFHLVYSTNWVCKQKVDATMPPELQEVAQRLAARMPLCCELTSLVFCSLLARAALELGFQVRRWPVKDRASWLAVGAAAKNGKINGAAAVMLHAWHGKYEKECIPSWDYYPVLEAVKSHSRLLYPSAPLDKLHSEKRYSSALMPPTKFLQLRRTQHGVRAGGSSVAVAAARAIQELRADAKSVGLPLENVVVKQGLSWGGYAVRRLRPSEVPDFLEKSVVAKMPKEAAELTVLLQAKIDLVGELRWTVVDGQLRGRGWTTLANPRLGRPAITGGYKNEAMCRTALQRWGLAKDEQGRLELEESLRGKVEQVVQEATADAGGEVPQYLRVDLLLDKQGRAWLGERESWGADLVRNQENPLGRTDPTKAELARAIAQRAAQHCLA